MHSQEDALRTLEIAAREQGRPGLAAEAREALSGLAAQRFNVAVLGQFKRGKSSLLNALLGRELLPADVAPITTAITLVEHGPQERVTARFDHGREEEISLAQIRQLVSEEENPGNGKGVRVVRIELPDPFLASGIRLVDTPGVGSVFGHNDAATQSFLPRIDVALVVLGCDPPISGEELALVRSAATGVGHMCFVLNKADLASDVTRVKAEAFTRKVLAEALGADPTCLIHASALTALRSGEDPGVARVAQALRELASRHGHELAQGSAARAARHVAARLLQQLDLEQAALLAPAEELDRRLATFLAAMRDIDDLAVAALARTQSALSYDWNAWQRRQQQFVEEARTELADNVAADLRAAGLRRRRKLREAAIDSARAHTRRSVEAWQACAAEELRTVREGWTTAASEAANRLIDRVAEAASHSFEIPVARFEPEVIEVTLGPVAFEAYEHVLFLDPYAFLVPLVDLLGSRAGAARRAAARAARLGDEWLQRNLHGIDQTMVRWLDTLSRAFEDAVRNRLDTVRREIVEAVAAGRRRREDGEAAVQTRLAELRAQRERVSGAAAAAARG